MLFDLRSRGRRRSVKVIYTGLALLLGVGLVGFGVGSVGGGSIFESVGREGGGGNSYAAKVTAAKKKIAKDPSNAAAWIALTEAQLHEASGGEDYSSATESYTEKGKQQLRKAARSWNHYLALNPSPPSVKLAREVANIFSTTALDEPANAVAALQIVIAAEPPSASLYSQLATYAYLAHNESQGDLAAKKAVALAPKSKRLLLEAELEKVKRSVKEKTTSSTAAAAGAGTTGAGTTGTGATGTGAGTTGTGATGAGTTGTTSATSSSSAAAKKK
jgi:hypothetical protein